MDPSQYCSGRHVLKPFLDESVSTAQQILVRGPLKMVTKASFATQSTPIPNNILSIGLIPNSPIYVFFFRSRCVWRDDNIGRFSGESKQRGVRHASDSCGRFYRGNGGYRSGLFRHWGWINCNTLVHPYEDRYNWKSASPYKVEILKKNLPLLIRSISASYEPEESVESK